MARRRPRAPCPGPWRPPDQPTWKGTHGGDGGVETPSSPGRGEATPVAEVTWPLPALACPFPAFRRQVLAQGRMQAVPVRSPPGPSSGSPALSWGDASPRPRTPPWKCPFPPRRGRQGRSEAGGSREGRGHRAARSLPPWPCLLSAALGCSRRPAWQTGPRAVNTPEAPGWEGAGNKVLWPWGPVHAVTGRWPFLP